MAVAKKSTVFISTLHEAGARAAAGTQHTGEHHDADDIIDDGGADDGGAEEALQSGPAPAGWPR